MSSLVVVVVVVVVLISRPDVSVDELRSRFDRFALPASVGLVPIIFLFSTCLKGGREIGKLTRYICQFLDTDRRN